MPSYNPGMRTPTILLGAILLCAATSSLAQIADGDQQWELRAEGHQGGHAKAARVDAAIAAYQKAVVASPNDLEARYKLLRALRFKAAYATSSVDEKKKLYTQAKKAGEDALTVVDRALAAKKISSVTKATEKQIADAARTIPHAGAVFLWDAVNWGEWALAYGKMAAVREGAADKIKREATIAMMVDPTLEGGAPSRVLGRLHDQTPHVPFITGWASNKEAVRLLNESLKIDPANKITHTFLAEAMVDNSSDTRPQAVIMLKDVVSSPNNETYAVEEAAAQDDARALLKTWGR
jgi:tetratricopeptide (TPR) repeat protein